MNLIKLIFIILPLSGLFGQAISTPKTIKPVVILENVDENAQVTFIAFEEEEGEYKTAKGYYITKNNNLIARPEIFDWSLDPKGTSFFSGAHYKDITGEGTPELIILITNPQTGTYVRSWTLGPGHTTKTPVHEQYYIKTRQKASEAVSSQTDIIYQDKDYELAICFGSPERKIVILDYQGELKAKVIGKKFLENNVGPIELETKDLNNDGMSDIYILSNGAIKEEKIYYAPEFTRSEGKTLQIEEKIRDVYFTTNAEGETKKIILLKNEQIYIEEWDKSFPTEEKGTHKIIGHQENEIRTITKEGNIVFYTIEENNKMIKKERTIKTNFKNKQFNKIEYLFINEESILISHNKEAEISIQGLGVEKKQKAEKETLAEKTQSTQKKPPPERTNINLEPEPTSLTEIENKQSQEKVKIEKNNTAEENQIENITINQDSLIINVGEKKEIKISLDSNKRFIGLEKIIGPKEMKLDQTKLAFIWEPKTDDAGPQVLQYRATHNIADEYEVYFENNTEKLRPKEELETTEHTLIIYVNAPPEIKISEAEEYKISSNHELVIPIYINDANQDQTLSINTRPTNIKNTKIVNRKFFWTPQNEDYGNNSVTFIVSDGILEAQASVNIFVDTLKTEIDFDQKLITTVNKEFVYDLPNTKEAQLSIIEAPENVRISKQGSIHWIPTLPQLGDNKLIIEIKEKDQTYFYNMQVFVNAPPIISYRPDDIEYVRFGDFFEFTMRSFEQNEEQKHFWSIKEKPATMQLDNATLSWQTDEPDYHKYHVELSDTIDTDNFYGYIYVNDFPKIISVPPTYVELGDTLFYKIIIEDKNKQSPYDKNLNNEHQYFLKTSPESMSLKENNILWIPGQEDVGQHIIEIEGYDGIEKAEQVFKVFVNDVPAIISDSNIKIAVGEELHHFVKATDTNDLTNLIFGINSSLDNMLMNTKTGEILWKPTEDDIGNHKIEVSVSDGFDLSNDIQTINIFVYKNPQFIEPTLPEAYAGVEYNHTIKAEDMYRKNISEIDVFVKLTESTFKEIIFDKSNYNLQIIPTFEELGTQYVSFILNDNYSNQIIENFPIKVLASPCETSDTLYVDQQEVINKLQKIDKSIVYTSKNEKLNILGNKDTSPDTIFITKYDTTITNITDSIFVTINNPEEYIKENTKLTKRQKRRAEKQAARLATKTKKTAKKQEKPERSEEEKKTPLVITTQHKNINIINKETVVVEQIILQEEQKEQPQNKEPLDKDSEQETGGLGHSIEGIKTPIKDKLQKHLFGQKSIEKTQKTEYIIPEFIDQTMDWVDE